MLDNISIKSLQSDFKTSGFAILREYIPKEYICWLLDFAKTAYRDHLPLIGRSKSFGVPNYHPLMMDMLSATSKDLFDYYSAPIMHHISHLLLGSDVYLYNEQFVVKDPGSVVQYPWHTDNFYGSFLGFFERAITGEYRSITCAWCLTDCTVENGAVWVLPANHTLASEIRNGTIDPDRNKEDLDRVVVPLEGKVGDLLIWDGNTLHTSRRNKSSDTRILWLTVYNTEPINSYGRFHSMKFEIITD